MLLLARPSSGQQQPISGPTPVIELPYLAQRTMLSDPSSHEFPTPDASVVINGRAKAHLVGDRIGILWTLVDYSTQPLPKITDSQYNKYPVGYQVTSVSFRSDGKLLIAGANQNDGRATIELWTFADPSVSPEGKLQCGRVVSRSPVFTAPVESDFGHVTWMSAGGALSDSEVLLMTYPGHVVYRFDSAAGSATPLISAEVAIGSVGPVAELASWWDQSYYGGRHVDLGHCYFLKKRGRVNVNDHDIVGCVLSDNDLDGDIDSAIVLHSKEDYAVYNLTDPSYWH